MRSPAVAGAFYPGTQKECERMLSDFDGRCKLDFKENIVSCVVPHAGWVYSGFTAMHSFKALKQTCERKKVNKPVFVIPCPNHYGVGASVAVSTEDWLTPLGEAACAQKVAAAILEKSEFASADESAHEQEHSAEVQLPFLQHLFGKDFEFVAVALMRQDLGVAKDLAKAVVFAAEKTKQPVFVVASSDLTHYEPAKQAEEKDRYALEAALKLDSKEFLRRVGEKRVTACGPAAIAASIEYAKLVGAKKSRLLSFSNSGSASGDWRVVDYASLVFF
ncbi:AmmeMemoRadiSam system protein B [Candidatus Micrarchaeota archaeon]|nr:AmmeMemoRadiSam system protein B [Candidatus Micrarchaeota archaeon]